MNQKVCKPGHRHARETAVVSRSLAASAGDILPLPESTPPAWHTSQRIIVPTDWWVGYRRIYPAPQPKPVRLA